MRIALYAPLKPPDHPTPSGDRRIAQLLIQALTLAGHQVEIASRLRSRDAEGNRLRQAKLADLGQRMAARLLRRYRSGHQPPDVWLTYHLYYKAPDWLGPIISAALDIPYVIVEASHAPKRAGGPWDLGHRAVEEAVRHAAKVICLNPNDTACLKPLAGDRLTLLPPFLDTAPYMPDAHSQEHLSQRRDIPKDQPLLLAVGMMRHGDKLASYRQLATALGLLEERPWHLLVAGDGAASAEVHQTFDPLSDRVTWLGALSELELTQVYSGCNILVWPAVREAFGMALLEAQAAGLPVVAGRTDGVPAVVADGETGLLTTPGDPAAFATAVASLLDDRSKRAHMGSAARERALKHHSLESAGQHLNRILSEVTCRCSA